ncbi:hypothetical protein AYO21_00914 [Fonsecaea monophora]|uniref:SRP9 domain-containing protein n=1 Tax=Fonsecaea monophora TaxID=254056 RepID=A0A177FNP6_9EURO|nr:hypothetical protein AYO21_00914 [Fonsecaea monophora]KAH0844444.1 hypothetical protein FOPE_09979 [Fonsecaea pedrosoi]OAG44952.1 hypothetical protein AYO21_00914 [Fonsecaea monophora]
MTYLTDLHSYLHQSSLLIQAYPSARITTKYALPRKPNTKAKSKPKGSKRKEDSASGPSTTDTAPAAANSQPQSKRERSAVLTLKTYHAESGICLKYRTDKAAEVGRLLTGLGRLAKGEVIEMPAAVAVSAAPGAGTGVDGDKMDIDGGNGVTTTKVEDKVVTAPPAVTHGAGGGKGKKKKGKK